MRRKILMVLAAVAMVLPLAQSAHASCVADQPCPNDTRVFRLLGISEVQNSHTYKRAVPLTWDNPDLVGDGTATFGIPKPSTLPPTQTTTPCSIARNTGPLQLNPPCAGTLTHETIPGPEGCVELTNPTAGCGFTGGNTWYYGYCAQTYGGASGIQFTFSGEVWNIDRMGFKRPSADVWEFNGKMTRLSPNPGAKAYVRLNITAVPNNPDELAACDVTHNLTSIYWTGVAFVNPISQGELPGITRSPGWHWCDGTDGC